MIDLSTHTITLMSYCINPHCQEPQNSNLDSTCRQCGESLLLKNRYRVLRVLGVSPWGRTFLTRDEDKPSSPLGVIKEYSLEIFPQAPLMALQLENLGNHDQIPLLWACIKHDHFFYIVQEYIEGDNLAKELQETGVFNEDKIWQLLREILPVLGWVHRHHVIHQDIKPTNIIRRSSPGKKNELGRLILVDFGAITLPLSEFNEQDQPRGSAEYIAPELIKGQMNFSSDLYSLGVTCLHLLTGLSPFELFDIKEGQWVWRDYLKIPVSDHLGKILERLIERNPHHRYQFVDDVLREMKAPLISLPVGLKKIHKTPQFKLGIGGISVALLAGLCVYLKPTPTPELSWRSEGNHPLDISPIPEVFPPLEKLDQFTLLQSRDLSKEPIWSMVTGSHHDLVALGKNGLIDIIELNNRRPVKTLKGHQDAVWGLAMSPDDRILASGGADKTIKLWEVTTGNLLRTLTGHNQGILGIAFSPEGSTLASVGKDQTIYLWEVTTGKLLKKIPGNQGEIQSVVFSPDQVLLITGGSDGTIKLWNWQTGTLVGTLQGHQDAVWSLAVSPDGQFLASGSWDNTIKIWDLGLDESGAIKGTLWETLKAHQAKINSLSFSPNGDTLVSADIEGMIQFWQMGTFQPLERLSENGSWLKVMFSPEDDRTFLTGSFDGHSLKVWRLP